MGISSKLKNLRFEAKPGEQYAVRIKNMDPANYGEGIYNINLYRFELLSINHNFNYCYFGIGTSIFFTNKQEIVITDKKLAKELGVRKNERITGVVNTSVTIDFAVAGQIPSAVGEKHIGDTFEFRGIFAGAHPKYRALSGTFTYDGREIPLELLYERLPNYLGPDYTMGKSSNGKLDPNAYFTLDFEAKFEGYIHR